MIKFLKDKNFSVLPFFIFNDIIHIKSHKNNELTSFPIRIRLLDYFIKKLLSLTSRTLKPSKEVAETTSLFQNVS